MDKINILWTGGWDSTYRVLKLLTKPVIIQPYYLQDNRKSEELELNSIESIIREIRNHPDANCNILELICKKVSDIEKDSQITNSYNQLLKNNFFGQQYEWLARFAKSVKNLELLIHKDDAAFQVIRNNGIVVKKQDSSNEVYYILDRNTSSEDLINVFGCFKFPILYNSKLEMKDWAEKNNLMYIMNKTWFCHKPINDMPCGICNPCIYTIEEGLKFRFTKEALRRYKYNKLFAKPIRNSILYKKLKYIYKNWVKLYDPK
jgi:7-cyano-7-deazaguanine synthase